MPLYNIRIIREGLYAVTLSVVLFLVVMFPNIPLGLEQVNRTFMGYDRLANSTSPQLNALVDEIDKTGEDPVWYIDEHFLYASDYEMWGNLEYWETPEEVIAQGRTDCEGKAIITKAVINLQSIRAKTRVQTAIMPQQQHVYLEVKKEENISGTPVNRTTTYYNLHENVSESYLDKTIKGLKEFQRETPPERQIIMGAGLTLIWTNYVIRVRRIIKEEKKKKKIKPKKR